jgi:phenylalanyl-tRNA synthetase alpha chain
MSDLSAIDQRFRDALSGVDTLEALTELRHRFLARTDGEATLAVKAIASRPVEERRQYGADANALKKRIEEAVAAREAELKANAPVADAVDATLPGRTPPAGRRHPLTQVLDRVEEIFQAIGFQVIEGPELEDDWHNFEALNMPPDHPARDMQDTLYLAAPVPAFDAGRPATLLRTHTSGMQIRHMRTHQPPIRIIAPGRVYRRDNFDATHTPMFSQVEGLVVDEDISLGDLKGTLTLFAQRLFGAHVKTRFRPSFFPYTEPSAELDVECPSCGGPGCALCKHTGWIEILGAGVINPVVLKMVDYDSERWSGFAFGIGVERVAMLLHGVKDLRDFYTNDLRFLRQFDEDLV